MKAYGLDRRGTCNRTIRGTSRNCGCCIPTAQRCNPRSLRKRARQQGKQEMNDR
jgi:hypothetical protein